MREMAMDGAMSRSAILHLNRIPSEHMQRMARTRVQRAMAEVTRMRPAPWRRKIEDAAALPLLLVGWLMGTAFCVESDADPRPCRSLGQLVRMVLVWVALVACAGAVCGLWLHRNHLHEHTSMEFIWSAQAASPRPAYNAVVIARRVQL